MENHWETWACMPETRLSHLVLMGDSDTQSVLLTCSFSCNLILVIVTAKQNKTKYPASQRDCNQAFQHFCSNFRIYCINFNTEHMEIWYCLRHTFKTTVIWVLKQLDLFWHGQSWFTWLTHKWVMDPFFPSSRVFCGWEIILKLYWKLRYMIMH